MTDSVITGIGVISSLGVGREVFWRNCMAARPGLKKITGFDTSALQSDVAGWIDDFNPAQFLPQMTYRRMSRASQMAVAASIEALDDSGLDITIIDKSRVAVIMGTAYGSSSCIDDFFTGFLREGPRCANPFLFSETVPNAPASHIAMFHRITGPNTTFCQNMLSFETALLYAQNILRNNNADIVLVGGVDELSAEQYACYDALGCINKVKAGDGGRILPRPGGGFILGEGAAVLVMEGREYARRRKANMRGMLKSVTTVGGGFTPGQHRKQCGQLSHAVSIAAKEAGISPDKIDQISICANFSRELDLFEYNQLRAFFKSRGDTLAVSPLKYLMGDFGGAGAVRAAAVLLSLYLQQPLPTLSAEVLRVDSVSPLSWNTGSSCTTRAVLMTSATLTGSSAGIIFTAAEECGAA